MKVRITEPALSTYTGMLYQISFTNGVSDRELSSQEVSLIGAAMRVESVEGGQVGASVDLINAKSMTVARAVEKNAEVAKDVNQAAQLESTQPNTVEQAQATPTERYTHDQLAEIADKSGIAGLREVGAKFGIKGRSINELIQEIMAAQGE